MLCELIIELGYIYIANNVIISRDFKASFAHCFIAWLFQDINITNLTYTLHACACTDRSLSF